MGKTSGEHNSISRREFLSGVPEHAALALALAASLEQSHGQEIKEGMEWLEGFRQLRLAALTLPNEISVFAHRQKNGVRSWVAPKGGEGTTVQRTMTDVVSLIEKLAAQGDSEIYEFHTHPLALAKLYGVTEAQLQKIRQGHGAVLPSFPPSIGDPDMQDDVSNYIHTKSYINKSKIPVLSGVADPRGTWIYSPNPGHPFVRGNFEIQNRFSAAMSAGIEHPRVGRDIEAFFKRTSGTSEIKIDQLIKTQGQMLRANGLLNQFGEPLMQWLKLLEQYNTARVAAKTQAGKFEDESFAKPSVDAGPVIKAYADLGVTLTFTPWEKMNLNVK